MESEDSECSADLEPVLMNGYRVAHLVTQIHIQTLQKTTQRSSLLRKRPPPPQWQNCLEILQNRIPSRCEHYNDGWRKKKKMWQKNAQMRTRNPVEEWWKSEEKGKRVILVTLWSHWMKRINWKQQIKTSTEEFKWSFFKNEKNKKSQLRNKPFFKIIKDDNGATSWQVDTRVRSHRGPGHLRLIRRLISCVD